MPLLSPSEMYPAFARDIAARTLTLPSGVRVRVAERGPSDGQVVVMVHGWGASLYMYRHAFDRLPARGFRVLALDLRGHGLSDKPLARHSYSLRAYSADLDALLDQIGVATVSLIAQSMGGGLALRYALANSARISKLVLINPTGLSPVPYFRVIRALATPLLDALGPAAAPRWVIAWVLRRLAYGDPTLVTPRDIDEYWAPTQLAGFLHAVRASLVEFDWSVLSDAEASALAVPTLVVLGNQDRLLHTSNAAAARLTGTRIERVPGGHCAHEEHPDLVYDLVAEFIR